MVLKILPAIDGKSYVKQIAAKADIELKIVRLVMQHLLFYGVIEMIDIF